MQIAFFRLGLDSPTVNAWFQGVYRSFFEALEELGCRVSYGDATPPWDADVLVVPVGGGQDESSDQAIRAFGGPVVLYVGSADYWFARGFLERWRDRILLAYGTDLSEYSLRAFDELGVSYYHLPFASNPKVMRPLGLPKLYDVVFVGSADSGTGRHHYVELLSRVAGDCRLLFLGSGWERYGFPCQSIAWGDLLNVVYNLAHVCINISNDEQKVADRRLDANNRLFDLAMAGCFQVSNAPQVVRRYFDETEVVAVDPPDQWVSVILDYLECPEKAEPFRTAALRRALAEHTWQHRAKQLLELIEAHRAAWQGGKALAWNRVNGCGPICTSRTRFGALDALLRLTRQAGGRLRALL